jgi:arylsulfatase A-like enzyme
MRYRRIVWALVVACCSPLGIAVRTAGAARPNVVFFLIDDLGWKDAGFMGSRYYLTPHVDRLAKQGMVFTSAYSNGPNCAPTRACLMSGWYSPRHGIYTVGTSERGRAKLRKLIPVKNRTTLADGVVTLAEALKSAGYVTAHMGKWHLGPDPKTQGFDVNIGGNRTGSPRGGYFSPYRNPQLPNGPKGEYLTDRLTDEALKFLDANRAKPFFLYLAHYAVHTPIQAKAELTESYRKRKPDRYHNNPKYAAMIDSVDQSVGRVLKKLDDLKLVENTIVVYTSDNGGYGPVTSQHPLRGSKGMLYEGGIRVPLIVRWPGHTTAGSRSDVPVASIDFYPTLLEAAGVDRAGRLLDGESLVGVLTQTGSLKRKALFWHFPAYLQAYRGMQSPWRTTPAGAVRAGDWKLIEFFEDGRLELYNLKDDVGESKNLAEQRPEKTRVLHRLLKEWRKSVKAPVPTGKNPAYDPNARPKRRKRRKRKTAAGGMTQFRSGTEI